MENLLENNTEQSIEILEEMKDFWFCNLNPEIISMAFIQNDTVAEIVLTFKNEEGEIRKQATNLDFISGGEGSLFDLKNTINENINHFLGLDGLSLIMCVDDIFNAEGIDRTLDPK